jgi:hypothetical protein
VARALDLPGAGANAKAPSSYDRRPLDSVAFSSEFSPNAGVTQEDRTRAVVDFVDETNRQTGAPVVLALTTRSPRWWPIYWQISPDE